MTSNQINYWKNQETERHNQVQEEIDKIMAKVKQGELDLKKAQAMIDYYKNVGQNVFTQAPEEVENYIEGVTGAPKSNKDQGYWLGHSLKSVWDMVTGGSLAGGIGQAAKLF